MSTESTFELRNGRIWVEARISGQKLWGIFDTGSDGTALDSEFAHSIGLTSQARQSGSTVAGKVEVEKVGRVDFDIGGKAFSSFETNTAPLSKQLKELQFVLGFDVLESSSFVLWPEKRRVVFGPFDDSQGLSFVLDGDIRPTTRFELLGASSHAFLDTGSSHGISLPRRWVEANAERLGIHAKVAESRKILGSEYESLEFTLEEMVFGGSKLTGVPAEAVESKEGSYAEQSTFWGNAGNGILQRFEWIAIDGRKRRLAFGDGH